MRIPSNVTVFVAAQMLLMTIPVHAAPTAAAMNAEERAVVAVLSRYETALNASDMDAVLRLYSPDGVLMAQNSPSSVGRVAVRAEYMATSAAISLHIRFKIAEVHQVSPNWAFARTNSAGTLTIHATRKTVPEGNQELFMFRKVGGSWKIARYSFSTTLPQ